VRRIQSLLQRKGFGFGIISQVLKELDILSN
jgi:SOS response regulatory protein OraA/RecX